jgi:hypothetical protein
VHAAGFGGTSVHTIHQAVYRARRHKPRFGSNPRPGPASESYIPHIAGGIPGEFP